MNQQQNNEPIPEYVEQGVEQEAIYASRNFRSGHSIQVAKYQDFYMRAVLPYAQKAYVAEKLILQQQNEIIDLREHLRGLQCLLRSATETIDGILKK